MVYTAGLLDAHDLDDESGIDLDDLGDDHSLTQDPTVVRLRAAAAALHEDAWIAVRLPGTYEGEDEIDDDAAISRWSTVVTHPDELGTRPRTPTTSSNRCNHGRRTNAAACAIAILNTRAGRRHPSSRR